MSIIKVTFVLSMLVLQNTTHVLKMNVQNPEGVAKIVKIANRLFTRINSMGL